MLRRLLIALLLTATAAHAQEKEKKPTGLAAEKSRYYSEAADGPVQWLVWSDAALAKAKKENKPIFVSIGYVSAWEVHVMRRDAFGDKGVAEVLNARFVPVLLDRHERPEIAAAYETLLASMTGTPSMPANLVLTPDLLPFAAVGFSKPDALRNFLVAADLRWTDERAAAIADSIKHLEKAKGEAEKHQPSEVKAETLDRVADALSKTWDAKRGGFGTAPKFTQPLTISFLFAYARAMHHEPVRGLGISTLVNLSKTPIHDQLGAGFHRGSVTADWRLPIFEKMLYDQALLATAYLEAWQLTKDEALANITRATLDYVLRDLIDASGAFWSAQDAHSYIAHDGRPVIANGVFYLLDAEEIGRVFKKETAELIFRLYGLKESGNVSDTDPLYRGRSLLWLREPELLKEKGEELVPMLTKVLRSRQGRPAPFRDVKVLAGWNAMTISALARAGAALDEPKYIQAATVAAKVITTQHWNAKTRTLYRTGKIEAPAEDYALVVQSLLDLFDATWDLRWLELANAMQARQDELFWSDERGRYVSGATAPAAIRGVTTEVDVDTPGANGVAAMNLLRFANLTNASGWRDRANVIFHSFGTRLVSDGARLPRLAAAYAASLARPKQIVVVSGPKSEETYALLRAAHARYVPVRAIVHLPAKGPLRERMMAALPFTKDLAPDPEHAAVYVCSNGVCEKPTPEPDALVKLLD